MNTKEYPNHIVFGLDIGTRSIIGTVGYKEETGRFQVLAQTMLEHETRAMLDGQIHDINAVASTIKKVVKKLEEKIDFELKDVCIAAAGRVLKTMTVPSLIEFDEETMVTEDHIHSLELLGVQKAYELLHGEEKKVNYYCVGYTVINYYLNDNIMLNLLGHKANKISGEVLATFLPNEVIDGLYSAVGQAGLHVTNLTLEPIAAMEIAIPAKLRLLNLALVDVGAGTSDISITKDGSIIAFGMIPSAGDEITETIARDYLVDFNTAEKIKQGCLKKKAITYKDIMGIKHKILAEEVVASTHRVVQKITKQVADKIIELNGGKSVSAVFIVGGGGKLPEFAELLAQELSLAKERVALRGAEVLGDVDFLEGRVKKDSMLVTPIGICLNYYEKKNNFIYVTMNGEQIKLYDNSKVTILDAMLSGGLTTLDLFPKRGDNLECIINQKEKVFRGEMGEAAVIKVNGKSANMTTPLQDHDVIEVMVSTEGKRACMKVKELPEYGEVVTFWMNGIKIDCPPIVEVNQVVVAEDYSIQSKDNVEILNYYTAQQLREYMDLDPMSNLYVNDVVVMLHDQIYTNSNVEVSNSAEKKEERQVTVISQEEEEQKVLRIMVNDTPVLLTGKKKYIVVDILDVYEFELTNAETQRLEIMVDNVEAEFTTELQDGASVKLVWRE